MLVFFALGNAKLLSFALGDANVPNANGFVSQWNIGLTFLLQLTHITPHHPCLSLSSYLANRRH